MKTLKKKGKKDSFFYHFLVAGLLNDAMALSSSDSYSLSHSGRSRPSKI